MFLFACSIFLILVGTLAQVDVDMWQVIDQYFRAWITWIDFQIFFPRSWFPNWQNVPGGFWFPGGATIGLALAINLIAAHLAVFTIQARGIRLGIGLVTLGLGVVYTVIVIISGHNPDGLQGEPPLAWSTIWLLMKVGLAVGAAGCGGRRSLLPVGLTPCREPAVMGSCRNTRAVQRGSIRRRPSRLFAPWEATPACGSCGS